MHGLLVQLRVPDYAVWRTAFDNQESVRRAYGCEQELVFVGTDGDDVLILLEWDDRNRAWMFAQSDDLWVSLGSVGTDGPLRLWLFEDSQQVYG